MSKISFFHVTPVSVSMNPYQFTEKKNIHLREYRFLNYNIIQK